jgi:hypothetical protein
MIKFFRKIRQRLLSEGKAGKYLKYAIGEIVLVMIGILLALQVNEWNKERTRKMNEALIIEQLIADLKKSQSDLEEIIERNEESARASAIVCHAFWKINTPHDSIFHYMAIPRGTKVYSPTLGTAKSLINSGNLALIKSTEIRNEITSYVEKVDYRLKDISRYEETYYRKARDLLNEIVVSTLEPDSYFAELIEESKSPFYAPERDEYTRYRPNHIEKVPFKVDKETLFQDKNVYNAYYNLLMHHRNGGFVYKRILESTDALLAKLEGIGEN